MTSESPPHGTSKMQASSVDYLWELTMAMRLSGRKLVPGAQIGSPNRCGRHSWKGHIISRQRSRRCPGVGVLSRRRRWAVDGRAQNIGRRNAARFPICFPTISLIQRKIIFELILEGDCQGSQPQMRSTHRDLLPRHPRY